MNVSQAIQLLRSRLTAEGKSHNTIKAYCSDVEGYVSDFFGGNWHAADIVLRSDKPEWKLPLSAGTHKEFMIHYINKHRATVSPSTTIRRMSSLRAMTKALDYPNPFESYKAPQPKRSQAHPLPDGVNDLRAMLVAAIGPEQRCLVALCGGVGLRISEALSVRACDFVHRGDGTIQLTVRGKGDKERVVPVSQFAFEHIEPMIRMQEAEYMKLLKMGDRWARRLITAMGSRAGVDRAVASHDLRMTFGSAVYDNTKDIRTTQELLGHASSKTTEGYTRVRGEAMTAAVEGLFA